MICAKCGNQLPDDARFCNRCGEEIATQATQALQGYPPLQTPQQQSQPTAVSASPSNQPIMQPSVAGEDPKKLNRSLRIFFGSLEMLGVVFLVIGVLVGEGGVGGGEWWEVLLGVILALIFVIFFFYRGIKLFSGSAITLTRLDIAFIFIGIGGIPYGLYLLLR